MTYIIESDEIFYQQAIEIIDSGRQRIVASIYNESTKSYYKLGKLIVEKEQSGKEKAEYGKNIIENLSKRLTIKYGKGFSKSTLWDCRKFYKKLQSLTGEFELLKLQPLTGESSLSITGSISEDIAFKLSFTHYTLLIRLDDNDMLFYEQYAVNQRLSVRELQKAIENNTILRLDKTTIKQNYPDFSPKEIIKDPYVLDFLGLDEINEHDENLLESRIVRHLEKFLLELGRGFAFVGRQYRLTIAEDSFFADLVFYNIPLKCYVIFELKTRKLKHQDLGQLQMYVNYFDRDIKDNYDNKTIGVLLCSDKNDKVVEYSLPEDNRQIFASKYKLYLPSKEELEYEMNKIGI